MGGIFSRFSRANAVERQRAIRRLYVMDFDLTIFDGDSVECLMETMHKCRQDINLALKNRERMVEVHKYWQLQFLLDTTIMSGTPLDSLLNALCKKKALVKGMEKLLPKIVESIADNPFAHFVVISDSFDYIIYHLMQELLPSGTEPTSIIANVATEKGTPARRRTLHFQPYETQRACRFCEGNLCKGAAMLKYAQQCGPFEQMVFIGAGSTDVCPALSLGPNDLLFVRKGHGLQETIEKYGLNFGHIKAKIVYFKSEKKILKELGL